MTFYSRALLSGETLVRSAFLYGVTRAMNPIHYVWMSQPVIPVAQPEFTGTITIKVPGILWTNLLVTITTRGTNPNVTLKIWNSGKTVTYVTEVFSSSPQYYSRVIQDTSIPTATPLEFEFTITSGTSVSYHSIQIFSYMPGAEPLQKLR